MFWNPRTGGEGDFLFLFHTNLPNAGFGHLATTNILPNIPAAEP